MAAPHLINTPPRLSDLPLDERKAAMIARDNERRATWLHQRERRGFFARIVDRVRG